MATRDLQIGFRTPDVEAHQVLAFREEASLGRPAACVVTVQFAEYVDPEALIGAEGELFFTAGDDGITHMFRGIIDAVTLIGSTYVGSGAVHHARLSVVSRMALLGQDIGSAIHQNLDVKEIVEKVLEAHGIEAGKQKWHLGASYPKREYCVQYSESALDFVTRLLEEEGIYYRSEFTDEGELVIFEDDSTRAASIDGDEKLPFRQRTGMEIDRDAIYSIVERGRVVSGKFTLRDYDFERPRLDMTCEAEADIDTDLEVYDFPGLYVEPEEGNRLAQVLLEAEQAARSVLFIEADSTRIHAGRKLSIVDAIHDAINGDYVVTQVAHEYGYGGSAATYNVRATLLPAAIRYRLPRTTPVPVIDGPQTARVVAPAGSQAEEIHTDEHGRCKVKFHWDLGPDEDEKASCWMRVGQLQTSGSMVLPRVDWEVIVEFLEGKPDRPIVTGRLYNGVFMPPYALPEGKTRTALQSATTPGGAGRNEIRFEDRAGAEEIMIRAQYDQAITTANNKTKNVGNCETHEVKVDLATTVGANQEVKITKGWQTSVGADQSVSVGGNRSVEVNAVTGLTAGGSSTTSVGGNHMEMDGNPLQALLSLAAQKAAEFAAAKAAEALAQIDAAVQAKVDQVMGPINALQTQVQELGAGMQAVANGDLGAAAGLLASAAALPGPGAFAGSLAGGQTASRNGAGGGMSASRNAAGAEGHGAGEAAGGGNESPTAGGGGAAGALPSAQQIAADLAIDQALNNAIQHGVNGAANALGSALGLDGGGGGGESEANEGGPEGSVEGVDATDRAKGPGHATSKIAGSLTENVGAVKVTAALNGIMTNVAGNVTQSIGAARVDMALGNRAVDVGGNKTESALGLVVISRGDETESVGASKTTMVGGAILEKIAGGHSITAGAPATFLGAFHKMEAATAITLKCGASEVVIDGGGISMTSPIVTITAGKVALTKAVSEV